MNSTSTSNLDKATATYIKDNYYEDCGVLRRKKGYKQWKRGSETGSCVGARGYKTVSILGRRYYVHRVIFFLCNGYLPELVDHINGDKLDNRPSNLREADKSINGVNLKGCHADNKTGYLGVTYRKDTGKFFARFKRKSLGCFDTAEEAHKEYLKAKEEETSTWL